MDKKFWLDGHNWTNSQSYVFSDDNFLVGQSSTLYSNFSGSIDDIAIWNKALAAEDINNYYSLASSLYVLQRILELDCKKILLDIGRSVEILMTSPEIIMDRFWASITMIDLVIITVPIYLMESMITLI